MNVTVYSTQTCPYCHQVKQYLAQRSIPFRDVDVSVDPAGAAEMVRLSNQRGVPVTVIDGQVIVGFDRRRIDALLEQAARPRLGAGVANAALMAEQGRCTETRGAYVGRVTPGGLADRAGLQVGDVIVSLAGRSTDTAAALEALVARLSPGQSVPLSFVRGGQAHNTTIRT